MTSPTVAIDYTAGLWQGAGIGRYTRELVRALVRDSDDLQLKLFYAAGGLNRRQPFLRELQELTAGNSRVRLYPLPLSPRLLTIIWQRLRLPLRVEQLIGALDVLHGPDFVLAPTRARRIVTIHDLTFLRAPEAAHPRLRRYLSSAVPRAVRQADRVLADSQSTVQDVITTFGLAADRVQLLYPGVDPRFRRLPQAELGAVRQRLGLGERFVLAVGTLEPRKNLVRLIHAVEQIAAAEERSLELVLAGREGWMAEGILRAIAASPLGTRIKRLDFVGDDDLPALYNLATVLAYPSSYEGFGFPALEALACGTAVVASHASSLPEVVGDAGILIDPDDSASLAAGLRAALARPDAWRERGPRQAARFSWERAGAQLAEHYRDLAGRPAREGNDA
jgi:glycosyltransferase involved in cell wall biosynthesis